MPFGVHFEPSLLPLAVAQNGAQRLRPLVRDPLFTAEAHQADAGAQVPLRPKKMQIIALLIGQVQLRSGEATVALAPGQFCLVPASLAEVALRTETPAAFLRVEV